MAIMLESNVWVAVHLVTECAGGVLHPDAIVMTGQNVSILVNPELCVPPASALPCSNDFPLFEDVEICGGHTQAIAGRIQGSLGAVMLFIGATSCFTMGLTVNAYGCLLLLLLVDFVTGWFLGEL